MGFGVSVPFNFILNFRESASDIDYFAMNFSLRSNRKHSSNGSRDIDPYFLSLGRYFYINTFLNFWKSSMFLSGKKEPCTRQGTLRNIYCRFQGLRGEVNRSCGTPRLWLGGWCTGRVNAPWGFSPSTAFVFSWLDRKWKSRLEWRSTHGHELRGVFVSSR